MNETSATSASGTSLLPDGIGTLTAIHFTIIGVLAILVIVGLLWGIRAKRSRVQASRDVVTNAEEAGVPPVPAAEPRAATQAQTQRRDVTASPVAPPAPIAPPAATAPPAPIAPSVQSAPAGDVPETPDRLADEPIAAASPLQASPATETAAPARTEVAPVDKAPAEAVPVDTAAAAQSYAEEPVTQLKGLGPKVAAQLGVLGVSTVGQMAALTESEAINIDAQLGNFTGRMGRDRWIEQARLLAAGDRAGFEAVFGKL